MRSPFRKLVLALAAVSLFAGGCSNGAPQQVTDPEGGAAPSAASGASGEAPAATGSSATNGAPGPADRDGTPPQHAQADGSGASAPNGNPPGADDATTAGAEGATGSGSDDGAPDEQEPPSPTPDIFATMVGAGFERVHEEDLADYLPVPPRSEGQVGQFRGDGGVVRVARVTYPAATFADPHERWLNERIAVLTTRFERVLRVGATVVHIDADSAALAERAQRAFAPTMPGLDGAAGGTR